MPITQGDLIAQDILEYQKLNPIIPVKRIIHQKHGPPIILEMLEPFAVTHQIMDASGKHYDFKKAEDLIENDKRIRAERILQDTLAILKTKKFLDKAYELSNERDIASKNHAEKVAWSKQMLGAFDIVPIERSITFARLEDAEGKTIGFKRIADPTAEDKEEREEE